MPMGDANGSKGQDYAYFHNAILPISSGQETLASCMTFACKDKVPAGSLYHVSVIREIIFNFLSQLIYRLELT